MTEEGHLTTFVRQIRAAPSRTSTNASVTSCTRPLILELELDGVGLVADVDAVALVPLGVEAVVDDLRAADPRRAQPHLHERVRHVLRAEQFRRPLLRDPRCTEREATL